MKKITSGILAVIMLLVSLVNIVAVSPVYASTDYKVEWTEDDFCKLYPVSQYGYAW